MSASKKAQTVSSRPRPATRRSDPQVDRLLDAPAVDQKVSPKILNRFVDPDTHLWLKAQILGWRQNVAEQQAFEQLHGASVAPSPPPGALPGTEDDPSSVTEPTGGGPSKRTTSNDGAGTGERDSTIIRESPPKNTRASGGPSNDARPGEASPNETPMVLDEASLGPAPAHEHSVKKGSAQSMLDAEPLPKKIRLAKPRRSQHVQAQRSRPKKKAAPLPNQAASASATGTDVNNDIAQPQSATARADAEDRSRSTRFLRFFTNPATADARLDEFERCVDFAIATGRAHKLEIEDLPAFVYKYFSSPGMGRLVMITKAELAGLGCEEAAVERSPHGARHPTDPPAEEEEVLKKSNSTYWDFEADAVLGDSHWYASLLRDYGPVIRGARSSPDAPHALGILQVHQCVHLDGIQLSDRSTQKASGWAGNGPTAKQCHAEMEATTALGLCGGEMVNATDARRDCAGPAIRIAERFQTGEILEGETLYARPAQQRLDQLEMKLFFGFLFARYGLRLRAAIAKGAEARVALKVGSFGHILLLDPTRLSYTSTFAGYDMPVYVERHAKFTALTTSKYCRSVLLLKTALHYVDIQQRYLRSTNGTSTSPPFALAKEIYDALSAAASAPTLPFDTIGERFDFRPSSTAEALFASVVNAEKEVIDWKFPEWTKPKKADLVVGVQVKQFSAIRTNSPLSDLITAAKAEKQGGGLVKWSAFSERAQKLLLSVLQIADPARRAPEGLVSARALLSEFGAITHRYGVFGQTSGAEMDRLYALPSDLKDHLHQQATTRGSTSGTRNWLDDAHRYLRYRTLLHLSSNRSAYRSTRLWLQALNDALPDGEKITHGARRTHSPRSGTRTFGAFGTIVSLTDYDSVMTPFGNSFRALLRSKGLTMKIADTIFGSKSRADYFKATVWAELQSKMDPGWDMGRLYSVMNVGGLATFEMSAARLEDRSRPHITDSRYWFQEPEGSDRNWSFSHVLNGALLDKIIYFEPLPDVEQEYAPEKEEP